MRIEDWSDRIFSIQSENDFNELAIEAFNFQFENIKVYREFCDHIHIVAQDIKHYLQIPYLPIEFFKTHNVLLTDAEPQFTFTSSGTTGVKTSKHNVIDISIYEQSFLNAFNYFFGNIEDFCVLALLPSYLEREDSSLVYMANKLIELSSHADSGFYLNNYRQLSQKLNILNKTGKKVLLLGVSYALLDLAEQFPQKLISTIIMETGGMKGHRKEMVKEELHDTLCSAFNVKSIYSEYGMTELLSQAYSKGKGVFETPSWMKVVIRDTYDPFFFYGKNRSGGINVIDLANINSCCFIETKDIGKMFSENSFTILGRFDNSDIRGCNLMVE